ncbi:MAG: GSCFA domain-containing protein [Rhodospirillaceae bacterium]
MSQPDLTYFPNFFRSPQIAVTPKKLLDPGDAVFTIGSCFALEVRRALKAAGFATYPDYAAVAYDRAAEIFDKIPEREMPAHYDTFTMRQEIEAALGVWTDREAGFLEVRNAPVNDMLKAPTAVQDPFRKLTYATTAARLRDLSARIDQVVREGLERARLFVITLGLTETWQDNKTGKYICRPPGAGYGGGDASTATFRASTFQQNYDNTKAMIDLLLSRFPGKHIVLSVSPVRLEKTFRAMDVGTANVESKSILRAVAGQISDEYRQSVTYYPSYEMALGQLGALTGTKGVFEDDGRHVRRDFVNAVTQTFVKLIT